MTAKTTTRKTLSTKHANFDVNSSTAIDQLQNYDGEFLLITRPRQGTEPQIWSSGDQEQTQSMFNSVDVTDTVS